MAKAKKTPVPQKGKVNTIDPPKKVQGAGFPGNANTPNDNNLRVNLAIGTITMLISVVLLYILNRLILSWYTPDIKAILDKVLPLTIQAPSAFMPEPVERMQFQLSLLFTPLFVFAAFTFINKKKSFFYNNPSSALFTNIAGITLLLYYILVVFRQDLVFVTDETTLFFYANNAIRKINILILLYLFFTYLFLLYTQSKETTLKKVAVNIISCGIVFFIIADIVMYNVFHLAVQQWGRLMETNAVFYSITQVYAGKSLLVNLNAQYGLYAWILCPLFKLIGLSTYKFSMVMAILNGLSFLLVYLGIKRLIRQDILSLLVFLVVTWWLYWQIRIPLESTSRYYYQYTPIRFLFPSVAFFLIVAYQTCGLKLKKIILPVLALSASLAVLWNMDTGIVVFGATLIALLYSAFDPASRKESIKRGLTYILWMGGALLLVVATFSLSTRMHTGAWPDFAKFMAFQNVFYVSGFFMLPMTAVHFWNLPVIVYLVACTYCVYALTKKPERETPVIVFLFILGAGIFAYFQGRSYDTNLDIVLYPSIILLGIFCKKLIPDIPFKKGKIKFHESYILFLIPFLFLIDSAYSMLSTTTTSIHDFAVENAFSHDKGKEDTLRQRIGFLADNLHRKDTVLVLAQDYDSYYYASGEYYNPVNLPGSTELFFKSEIDTLLNCIKTTKYPIIYDAKHISMNNDAIVRTLAQYTAIEKTTPDKTLLLLRHADNPRPHRLIPDSKTIYYNNAGAFNNYINPSAKVNLRDTFAIEFFASLDPHKLQQGNVIFSNSSAAKQYCGFLMVQYGPDLNQYMFTYGNGRAWCNGVVCKLSAAAENHVIIRVQKNMIAIYNNDQLCGTANTNSAIANSDGIFFINPNFAGTVDEIKIGD